MESIKELREKLQSEKVNPAGWSRTWGYKTFQRGPSIYITRLLLPFPILPTYVTLAAILLGIAGCYFILQFEWQLKLAGLFLIYLSIIADKVDGEIARYKKIFSLRGIFLDEIYHLAIPSLFWLSLAFGISKITVYEMRFFFAISFIGALSLILNRAVHSLAPQIFAKKFIKQPELFILPNPNESGAAFSENNLRRFIRFSLSTLHQWQDLLVLIATTSFILVLETLFRSDAIFHPFLAWFVIGMSAIQLLFVIENIIKKCWNIEKDIASINEKARMAP